ncbi:MAG: ATP-binding protein [Gemmatimonadetes bacterium]|nr:ATP-binding protein [Gemmatimonadota bacterium]
MRTTDGVVVGATSVTAAAAHYVQWDSELKQTVVAGIAIVLALAALAGIGVYRMETGRRESDAQLVAARDAAEATARSRGEFLANMSHEIRTPLHGVLGMTEALLASPHTEADRRSLSVINRSASSLLGILNDILDYSKLEAGRVDLVNAAFDPRALVDDVSDLFAVRAEEKSLDLAVQETSRADRWPIGDATRIRQVLLNLVGNAVKFTEAGSVQVEISTVAIGRKTIALRIGVRDTGIGIEQDVQARVFEQFSQAETSTARRYGGTGLGLTISRQLVGLMGGAISVTSSPGKGSEFVLSLHLPAAQMGSDQPIVLPFPVGQRVLICTPHPATLASLSELCARERLVVEACTTVDDARRVLARGERVAVAFCDGFGDDRHPHPLSSFDPPLVLLTTVHHPLNNSTLSTLGAVSQLRRPVRQDQFSALIADLAAGRLQVPPADSSPKVPPKVPQTHTIPIIAESQKPAEIASDAPQVLVVDDVDLNLLVARAMLSSMGVRVLTATGGEQALELLSKERMDLVFMDCHMPSLDGYEVTSSVRSSPGPNRDTPIVALSASAFAEGKDRAMASGMNDFATKPIELDALRKVLARWTTGAAAGVTASLPAGAAIGAPAGPK